MSKEERLKELRAKKKEEKKLRGEGRWKDMALLLGSAIQVSHPHFNTHYVMSFISAQQGKK